MNIAAGRVTVSSTNQGESATANEALGGGAGE